MQSKRSHIGQYLQYLQDCMEFSTVADDLETPVEIYEDEMPALGVIIVTNGSEGGEKLWQESN